MHGPTGPTRAAWLDWAVAGCCGLACASGPVDELAPSEQNCVVSTVAETQGWVQRPEDDAGLLSFDLSTVGRGCGSYSVRLQHTAGAYWANARVCNRCDSTQRISWAQSSSLPPPDALGANVPLSFVGERGHFGFCRTEREGPRPLLDDDLDRVFHELKPGESLLIGETIRGILPQRASAISPPATSTVTWAEAWPTAPTELAVWLPELHDLDAGAPPAWYYGMCAALGYEIGAELEMGSMFTVSVQVSNWPEAQRPYVTGR